MRAGVLIILAILAIGCSDVEQRTAVTAPQGVPVINPSDCSGEIVVRKFESHYRIEWTTSSPGESWFIRDGKIRLSKECGDTDLIVRSLGSFERDGHTWLFTELHRGDTVKGFVRGQITWLKSLGAIYAREECFSENCVEIVY